MNPTLSSRHPTSLFLCATLCALACDNSVAPQAQLDLSVHLGKSEFFEGEPLYVVFDLANLGPDTAWTMPFNRGSWNLRADLRRSDGTLLPEGGPIVDYLYPPGYRGEPLAPGDHVYDVMVMQDYWGSTRADLRDVYISGRNVPPGQYEFTARFSRSVERYQLLQSAPIRFSVRARSPAEDSALQVVIGLAAMAWDTLQRPFFLSSLVAHVSARDGHDPFVPYLAGPFLGVAWAIGYIPDSAATEQLLVAQEGAADAQRDLGGGALAVLGAYSLRRSTAAELAEKLKGSLAGVIAEWILSKQAAPAEAL